MRNLFSSRSIRVALSVLLGVLFLQITVFRGLNETAFELSLLDAPILGQSTELMVIPPSSPIDVELSLMDAPLLGQPIELRCVVASVVEAPNATLQITLPEGITRIEGDLSWSGDIPADETVEIRSAIEVNVVGNWTVKATAGYSFSKDGWYGDVDRLHISVPGNPAHIDPTFDRRGPAEPVEAPPDVAGLPFAGNTPEPRRKQPLPESPETLTVTGRFWCYISEDSIPLLGQIRNDELQPMCWGNLWILRHSDDALLGFDITGPKSGLAEGYFEIPIENPGADGFYAVMLPTTSACHVTYPDGSDYESYTPAFYPSPSDTSHDIGDWRPPDQWDYTGAWRIYESIAQDYYDRGAWDFMTNEGPGYIPPEVTVRYKMPDGHGTHIHLDTGEIHIDEIDYSRALDIVQHEYGHWVMYNAYEGYWPPNTGGAHYMNLKSNINMAWTEGWADFFPLVCQSYGRWEDSVFEWGTGSQINLETPTWGTPGWDEGDEVEGHVAGALWDVHDTMNDGLDTFAGDFLDLWNVLSSQTDDSFAQYYSAWRSIGENLHTLNFAAYQNTIDYNLFPVLSDGSVDPQSGYPDTQFTFLVKYADQDADPAVAKRVYVYDLGWQYFEMDPFVGNPIEGEWFVENMSGFSAGNHDFFFFFTDGICEEYDPDAGYYSFTVVAAFEVVPSYGPGQATIELRGYGLPPYDYANLSYSPDGQNWVKIVDLVPADELGRFVYVTSAPDLAEALPSGLQPESYSTIIFKMIVNGTGQIETDVFEEYKRGLKQVDGVTAADGYLWGNNTDFTGTVQTPVLGEMIIAGKWFHPGTVTILWDGTTVIGTTMADAAGFFNTTIAVPMTSEGTHSVVADDGKTTLTFEVNVVTSAQATFQVDSALYIRTEEDTLSSGDHTVDYGLFALRIYNDADGTDTVLGDVKFNVTAENIMFVSNEEYADWDSTHANWTFPPEFTIDEGHILGTSFSMGYPEKTGLNVTISRRTNQTIFSSDGYQKVEFTVNYANTDFLGSYGLIVIHEQLQVNASFVPGTFWTDAPLESHFEDDHVISFYFREDLIEVGIDYNFSTVVRVELTGTSGPPILYKPALIVWLDVHRESATGVEENYVAEMSSEMLPDFVYLAQASTNTSNIWSLEREDLVSAILSEVSKPLDLSAFPLPFALEGAVNSTVVIGTSDPHGPCGSAHTLDTVGGMGVTAVLGTCGCVADCRFYLDTDIAWYNETEYRVHYWPVEGLTNIITIGGPGVNMITWKYFCNPWYAPVYMYYDGGLGEWVVVTPTATYRSSDWIGTDPLTDLVVLEMIYVPEEGRGVLWIGGFGGYATRAGCLALQLFDSGKLPFTLEGKAMLIQWIDENGNAKVDPTDTWNTIEIVP